MPVQQAARAANIVQFQRLLGEPDPGPTRVTLTREVQSLERELEGMLTPADVPDGAEAVDALEGAIARLESTRVPANLTSDAAVELLWEPAHEVFAIASTLGDRDLQVTIEGLRRRTWIVGPATLQALKRDLVALGTTARTLLQRPTLAPAATSPDGPTGGGPLADLLANLHTLASNPPTPTTRLETRGYKYRRTVVVKPIDHSLAPLLHRVSTELRKFAAETGDATLMNRADTLAMRGASVDAVGWNLLLHEMRALVTDIQAGPREPLSAGMQLEGAATALQKAREELERLGHGGSPFVACRLLREASQALAEAGKVPLPGAMEVIRFDASVARQGPYHTRSRTVEGMAIADKLGAHLDALRSPPAT